MKKIIYLLVGIVLFGGLYYSCVPEELPGSIYGTVVDKATGEPIKVAGVELSPSGLKTVTGSEGQFEFTELDPGKYTLLITKTGYIDGVSHTIEVKPGQQAKGDVQIEKLPPALKVVNDNREEISILDFGSAEDDVARSFSVFNDGTETLEWELTATADWIKSVSKTTGALSAGATQAIIITIDRAKLSSGENKTTVHITSNSGNKQLVVTTTNNFQVTKLNVLPTTAITSTSATLNGEVVEDGSPIYTERGFVYAETTQPTISACIQKIAAPFSDSKTFAATVSDLVEGKKYYVRAYAIQSGKEMYSVNEVSLVTNTVVLPSVVTSAITNVGKNSATAGGNVTNDGGASVTERGVVYGTSQNPTVADNNVSSGNGKGAYTCNLTNLQEATTYYVRAYAINEKGTAYGEEVSFTTSKEILLPSVTTSTITQVSETTAVAGGNVTSDGGASVTERGVCIATVSNPTTSHSKITAAGGTGTFTCAITGLQEGTTYFVRAYATNSKGTAYGEQVSFTTAVTISLPSVTTSTITQITTTTAVAGGNVTSDGGASVSERGVVYSLLANPAITDLSSTIVRSGNGTGAFTCNLSNLQAGTTYYVRAYAINEKGTAYGEEVTFITNKQIVLPSVTTATVTQITEMGAVAGGVVTSDGGASVTERGVVYATTQNPTTADNKVSNGSGMGTFTCNLTSLQPNTTYYVRAYAVNSKGTAYGEEVSFTTKEEMVDNPPSNLVAMPFSVSAGKQVTFSQGNLQYTQSTNTWSFAENQYDYIGTDNLTGGRVYSDTTYGDRKSGTALADKIDLFGWSTVTRNFGVSTSKLSSDYSGSFVDWGTNQIGADAPNTWRTLSYGEWDYLLNTRPNASSLKGVAQVNGVNGLIFLPDNWTCPSGVTFKSGFHNNDGVDYYAAYQTFTAEQWSKLEAAGAVFLPAAGYRSGTMVTNVQHRGDYWSATEYNSDDAYYLFFYSGGAGMSIGRRYYGRSVRLVKDL